MRITVSFIIQHHLPHIKQALHMNSWTILQMLAILQHTNIIEKVFFPCPQIIWSSRLHTIYQDKLLYNLEWLIKWRWWQLWDRECYSTITFVLGSVLESWSSFVDNWSWEQGWQIIVTTNLSTNCKLETEFFLKI